MQQYFVGCWCLLVQLLQLLVGGPGIGRSLCFLLGLPQDFLRDFCQFQTGCAHSDPGIFAAFCHHLNPTQGDQSWQGVDQVLVFPWAFLQGSADFEGFHTSDVSFHLDTLWHTFSQ